MSKQIKVFWSIIFIIVVIWSVMTVTYFLHFDILTDHDIHYAYGRTFFKPEHGRYFATFFNNLFIEVIPEILNIHPNDFQPLFIAPLKGILISFTCLYIANGLFFSSKNDNSLLKIPYNNPAFILTYIVIFLTLFNKEFYFFSEENTVFFEYSMSTWIFLFFTNIYFFYYINNDIPNKTNYILLITFTFLLGLTLECINIPCFIFLNLLFFLFFLIERKKERKKERNLFLLNKNYKKDIIKIGFVYIVYFISLICYYIPGNDQHFEYNGSFYQYCINNIIPFIKMYFSDFISKQSIILLPLFITSFITLLITKDERMKNINKRVIIYIFVSLISFLIYYALMFFIGFGYSNTFWLSEEKLLFNYKIFCLFYLLIIVDFLLNSTPFFQKNMNKIKIILCFIILSVFNKFLIFDYYTNIENNVQNNYKLRVASYMIEKIAVTDNSEDLIIPHEIYNQYNNFLWFNDNNKFYYKLYLNHIHPSIWKNNFILSDEILKKVKFTDEELKELKFSNLLKEKMYRHKKETDLSKVEILQ